PTTEGLKRPCCAKSSPGPSSKRAAAVNVVVFIAHASTKGTVSGALPSIVRRQFPDERPPVRLAGVRRAGYDSTMRLRTRHYAAGDLVDVVCAGDRIVSVGPPGPESPDRAAGWAAPALFDLQINGCGGVAFSSERLTADGVRRVLEDCRAHGLGGLCPTLVTN